MDPQDFTCPAAGRAVKAETGYWAFVPAPLPPPIQYDAPTTLLLSQADAALSELSGLGRYLPNPDLLIAPYVKREAVASSRIEGTQADLSDLLLDEIEPKWTPPGSDVLEVRNYVAALNRGIRDLEKLPLSCRLLRDIHAVLMAGVRGHDKTPGEFRRSQNWIGPPGCTLADATYVPPPEHEMKECLTLWERFLHQRDTMPELIQCALIHEHFEAIHPFLDGNGRIGRLLITLHLMEEGVLTTPALSISSFLKQHQAEYYDRMSEVRSTGNYEQWVKFFLQAVYESASDAIAAIEELTALLDTHVHLIAGMGCASGTTMRLFSYLETHPIIDIESTASSLEMAFNTAEGAIERLIQAGILHQATTTRRGRTFVYTDYLGLLRKGTE